MPRAPFRSPMTSRLLGAWATSLVLGLACADSSPSPTPADTPAAPSPAVDRDEQSTKTEPAAPPSDGAGSPDPTAPEDGADSPAFNDPPPPPAEPANETPMRVVAAREGWMELLTGSPGPTLVIDGEPLPVTSGRPVRHATGDVGLTGGDIMGLGYFQTLAFTGDLNRPNAAWLTTVQHYDRQASEYTVYERSTEGWRPLSLGKGLLRAYYASYVEQDGAVLALRRWSLEPDEQIYEPGDEGPEVERLHRATKRALARARPAWVQLAGPSRSLPSIPAGVQPTEGVIADDGTLYAIATEPTKSTVLLTWPKGSTTAQRIELPADTEGLSSPRLFASGSWALVSGTIGNDFTYLAVGRGDAWEAIEVRTKDRGERVPNELVGALRTPSGELWIAFGNQWDTEGEAHPLWRRTTEGEWEPVSLPSPPPGTFSTESSWEYAPTETGGGSWGEVQRGPLATSSWRATGLTWSDGAVWASLELGSAYSSDDMMLPMPRAVLLTTKAGSDPVVVLPSTPAITIERQGTHAAGATPGVSPCELVSVVLGPPPADAKTVAGTLATLELPDASVDQVYVGQRDGTEVLVATVHTFGRGGVKGLAKRVGKAAGLTAELECRVLPLVRMVSAP